MNKCIYNIDPTIIATVRSAWQDYDEPIKADTPAKYIYQLKGTDVDTVMICPTSWKLPLYPSKVNPHWEKESPSIKRPYFTADMKYQDKVYFRLQDFMLKGNDPIKTFVDAANEIGIEPFISYRMNDHHYLDYEDSYIHPKFWKENPKFWISESYRYFAYIHDEVRDFYFSLLEELVANYDICGLELDFMRSPVYFTAEDTEEGTLVMTGFVKRVRDMLDSYGEKKNKRLKLCVRVPNSVKRAKEIGLDVGTWDEMGIIDMVNTETPTASPHMDVREYKEWVKNALIYAEMGFTVDTGKTYSGYSNAIARYCTKEMYRGFAQIALDKGLDGVSFFNFDFTRHHFFNEPRRLMARDAKAPIDALKGISDLEKLSKMDKNYITRPPRMHTNLDYDLYVADKNPARDFKHSILRIKTVSPCEALKIPAQINGIDLEEIDWLGELFLPITNEALPNREQVKCYRVPTEILKHGYNKVTAQNMSDNRTLTDKWVWFDMLELALYKENSFLED